MKSAFLLGAIIGFFLSGPADAGGAGAGADVWLYHLPVGYSGKSYRDNSKITGIYGALRLDTGLVWEGGLERTRLEYKNGFELEQTDMTASLSWYPTDSRRYRIGVHSITADYESDEGFTLFAGWNNNYPASGPYQSHYGAELYYSHYPDSRVRVWQVTPSAGKYLPNPVGTGTLLLEGRLYSITVDAGEKKDGHLSVEGRISWFRGPLHLRLSAWTGHQSYAVRDGGFTVYNLAEEHRGGVAMEAGYAVTDNTRLSLGIATERTVEAFSEADVDITAYKLILKQAF